MRACWSTLTFLFLIIGLLSCKGAHPRPASVPSSAVWVDNAFIDCSVESPSKGNHCTVYEDDSGKVLADGLFVLKNYHEEIGKPELQYAAFAHGMIYLQDARVLVHVAPLGKDPSRKRVIERLETLAMKGSSGATDCSKAGEGKPDAASACALGALAKHQAFYVFYYKQHSEDFEYSGIAANEAGNAYYVVYNSTEVISPSELAKEFQTPFDSHTFVAECPAPVHLRVTAIGWLACTPPPHLE